MNTARAWSLDQHIRSIDPPAVLEEQPDRTAAAVELYRPRHIIGRGHRGAIHLHDDIARLHSELIGHARADAVYERSTRAADPTLGADGRRERHELELAQHFHLLRAHLGQVRDGEGDRRL